VAVSDRVWCTEGAENGPREGDKKFKGTLVGVFFTEVGGPREPQRAGGGATRRNTRKGT